MEKNIENNTENKFGNFLNFMKKFLAMSFFCAIAAFGFGALNVRAEVTPTSTVFVDKSSDEITTNVTNVTIGDRIVNKIDGVYYGISNNDTEALQLVNKDDKTATIYAKFNYITSSTGNTSGTPVELKKINANVLNSSTQLKDLTITGYSGGIGLTTGSTVNEDKKLDTLKVLDEDGKGVGANKLATAKTELIGLVKEGGDITTPNNFEPLTTEIVVDKSTDWKLSTLKPKLENIKVKNKNGNNNVDGKWEWKDPDASDPVINLSDDKEFEAKFTPYKDDGTTLDTDRAEIFKIKIAARTPAKAEKREVEYEAGKTTWGELLAKVQVNTSKDKGATGTWSVQAGNLGGPVIKYSGTGSLESVKMESGLTEAVLTYTAGENDAFADSSSSITIKLTDISKNLEEKFGKQTTFGDYTFYVNEKTGETSTILSKNGTSLLREESHGTAAWYGFDNSEGALPEGSVVSVKWYGKEDAGYSEKLEKATKGIQSLGIFAEDDKVWVFELNAYKKVTDDNGAVNYEKVSDFGGKTLKVYIELGDDWDISDVNAIYMDENNKVTTWNKFLDTEIREINGVYKRFAVLNLKHFSPHIVYDEKTAKDIMDKLTQAGEKAKADYMKNLPEGAAAPTKDELDKIAADAITKAYEELSQEEKEQLEEYMKKMFGFENKDAAPPADTNKGSSGTTDGNTSGTSNKSSGSNKSSSSTSSTTKTGKNETLSALLFLLCGGGTLSLNLAMRKKYFNA